MQKYKYRCEQDKFFYFVYTYKHICTYMNRNIYTNKLDLETGRARPADHVYVYTYIYVHMYIHGHKHIYTYIHIYMYICIFMDTNIYT